MRFCWAKKHQARNEREYQSGGMWMHTMELYACVCPLRLYLYSFHCGVDVQRLRSEFNDVSYLLVCIFFLFHSFHVHAVIRSLTKNYCVFSFIVHSCKLQCNVWNALQFGRAYVRTEGKKIIHIIVHLVAFRFFSSPRSTLVWTLVHIFSVLLVLNSEQSEKNEAYLRWNR